MSGFFGTEAGFFVDLFLVVLVVMLPVLLWAVRLVRRGQVKRHARVMTACYVVFLFAVVAFEIQVRLEATPPPLDALALAIHLTFAIPATLLWTYQIARGKRVFDERDAHRRRGRILIALFCATVATGVWLYAATFV